MELVLFSTMELLVLTFCLLGVVSSLPLEVEQVLPQGDDTQAQLVDDLPIDQDPALSQKENVRVIRQYDPTSEAIMAAEAILMPRTMEAAGMNTPDDCVPYYGRTHPISMPILSGLSSYSNIIPETHATSYTTSATADIRRGYLNQGIASSLGSPISPLPYAHESQQLTGHQAHSYLTTVPYISGYRMSPIYSEKQIVVRDYAHPEYQVHPQVLIHPGQGTIHPQNQYSARSADDLLKTGDSMLSKGMDFNIIFGQPLTPPRSLATTSELRSAEDYDNTIEDLRQRLEHLESLRQNVASFEDSSEPKEQVNYV